MRIITKWQAMLTMFIVLAVFMTPLVFALSYVFVFMQGLENLVVLIIGLSFTVTVSVIAVVMLIARNRQWSRTVQITYRKEYAWVFFFTGFGVVGIYVMLERYFNVNDYFLHIMIPLFIAAYYGLAKIGAQVFNVPLFLSSKE